MADSGREGREDGRRASTDTHVGWRSGWWLEEVLSDSVYFLSKIKARLAALRKGGGGGVGDDKREDVEWSFRGVEPNSLGKCSRTWA